MFWQFFLAAGGILLVCFVLLGLIIINWAEKNEYNQAEEELNAVARLVQESVRGYSPGLLGATQQRLSQLEEELSVRIDLYVSDQSLADTAAPVSLNWLDAKNVHAEVLQAKKQGKGIHIHGATGNDPAMMFLALRCSEDCPVRVVRVGLPLRIIEQRIQAFRWQIWSTVGIAVILGVVMAFGLTYVIIRPLHELASNVEEMAAGEYGGKVFADGKSEISILARHFNLTSERINAMFAQMGEDRDQLRAVLGGMSEGVIAVDTDQRILFANHRAANLLGFEGRTAVGRRLWEVARYRPIHEAVEAAMENKFSGTREMNCKGASPRTVSISSGPLPGSPPRGAVLVLHDVTELRRLERIRQDFVANVSHELKTPLTVNRANVEMLLDGAAQDPDHRGLFLKRIEENSERLGNLIQDLISLARIESGEENFSFEDTPVEDVIEACVRRRRTLLEGKQQTLEILPPPKPLTVRTDEEAALQILDNLVDNAIKYTPNGGRVTVRWWEEDEFVYIEVKDTGIGISEANLARIFERFYRVDRARSREMGGTGLGLSIVKHLSQVMRGGIKATSVPEEGSKFTFWLPCQPVAESVMESNSTG